MCRFFLFTPNEGTFDVRTPKTKRVRADYVAFQSAPVTKLDDEGLMTPEDAAAEFDRWLREHDAKAMRRAASLLNEWLLAEKGPSVFDRGLHLLGCLADGTTPEQYGKPNGARDV